jgi:hypothetical protein
MSKWLDAAKRAEPIERKPVLSVVSVLSEGGGADPAPRTTAPPARTADPKPSAEAFRHGVSVSGKPKTWTGRIVSLDAWRNLTEWEKHGPNGRHWNGRTRQWETPKGNENG